VDSNLIFFSLIAIASLAIFFFIGPMRASEKQRNRANRIDWTSNKYWFAKYLWVIILIALLTASLFRIFL